MDYKAHYQKLIEKASGRSLSGYYESHHVIPRCIGGTDDSSNLIKLTPEEHYLAHLLLVKIYPTNPRLASAAMMMCANRKGNKVYGWLRRRHAEAMSIHQSGDKNSQFGTVWIHKDGKAQKVGKEILHQYLNDGWQHGRKQKPVKAKRIRHTGIDTEKYKWILEQEEEILREFDEFKSVNRILQTRGFKNREGNSILSNWLKSKGRKILKRRNTNAGFA
jgi:hypothetical protein